MQKTNNNTLKNNKSGFTLIELLVVIVIIGILATLAIVALGGARAKARDAKRIADIKQLQTALELYSMDAGSYPPASGVDSLVPGQPLTYQGKVYMAKVPNNPLPWVDGACTTGSNYVYSQTNGGTSYTISYCLATGSGNAGAGTAMAWPGSINSQCAPNCSGKACGSDGCGGTCGAVCLGGTPVCKSDFSACVACNTNSDCSGGTPYCNEDGTACVACLTGNDCPESAGNCVGGTCIPF